MSVFTQLQYLCYVLFNGLNTWYIAIPVKNKSMHAVLSVASIGIKLDSRKILSMQHNSCIKIS